MPQHVLGCILERSYFEVQQISKKIEARQSYREYIMVPVVNRPDIERRRRCSSLKQGKNHLMIDVTNRIDLIISLVSWYVFRVIKIKGRCE